MKIRLTEQETCEEKKRMCMGTSTSIESLNKSACLNNK